MDLFYNENERRGQRIWCEYAGCVVITTDGEICTKSVRKLVIILQVNQDASPYFIVGPAYERALWKSDQ